MARRGMRKGKPKKKKNKPAARDPRTSAGGGSRTSAPAVAMAPSRTPAAPAPTLEVAPAGLPAPAPERNFVLVRGRSVPDPIDLSDLPPEPSPDELDPADAGEPETAEEAVPHRRTHKRRTRAKPVGPGLPLRRAALYLGIGLLVALVVLLVLQRVDAERTLRGRGHIPSAE